MGKNRGDLVCSIGAILLIGTASVCLYVSTVSVPFLLDDLLFISSEDNEISGISSFLQNKGIFLSRSLLGLSYAVNYEISKDSPAGYHVVNICLHAINCILLFFTLRILIALTWKKYDQVNVTLLSLAGVLFFVVHPLITESVAYVSGRSSLLYTMFLLLSLILFLKSASFNGYRGLLYLILSLLSYVAALASKEIALLFPAILFTIVSFFPLFQSKKRLFLSVLPSVFMSLLFIIVTMPSVLIFNSPDKTSRNLLIHIMTEIHVFADSVMKIVFPINLNFDPDYEEITSLLSFRFIIGAIILAVFIYVAFYFRIRNRFVSFSFLWFLVLFFPHLFMRLRDYMSEHWLYFPLAAVPFLVAGSFGEIFKKSEIKAFSKPIFIFIGLIFFFVVLTVNRLSVWQSAESIWRDAAKKSPGKFRTHANLGAVLLKAEKYAEAKKEIAMAMAINPGYAEIHSDMALVYSNTGEDRLAIEEYSKALQYMPYYVNAGNSVHYNVMINMGVIYFKHGETQKAMNTFWKAVRLDPDRSQAYNNIGIIYMSTGRFENARKNFLMAIRKKGNNKMAYLNLADLYIRQGKKAKAIELMKEAGLTFQIPQP